MGTDRLKYILFGIFLILVGLSLLGTLSLGGGIALVAGVCAVIAGILMLLYRGYGYGYGYGRRRHYWR